MKQKPYMLIADDEAVDREILKTLFEKDYTVLVAENGAQALAILRDTAEIKIVLLDLVMPEMNGFAVLEAMQKDAALCKIPVLVAAADAQDEQRALACGAADFVAKPYRSKILLQRTENLMQRIVAQRDELEHKLHSTVAQLEILSSSIPGGMGAVEQRGNTLYVLSANSAFAALLGCTEQEFAQKYKKDFFLAVHPDDRDNLRNVLKADSAEQASEDRVLRLLRTDGSVCWVKVWARLMEHSTETLCYSIVILDISSEVTSEQRANTAFELMRYRTEHDALTGICNRENFAQKTVAMLRENPKLRYNLVRWNIERFKVINELFGTATGDRLLVGIAGILRKLLHGIGTYARFEADHFAMCYPESFITPQELLRYSDAKLKEYGLDYGVVSSLGLYRIENITLPINQMCDRANLALQTIKGNYIKRFAYYDDTLRNTMLAEQQIVSEMNRALETGQFQVYLQPIFSVATDTPESAEALVRWKHPKLGMIPPGQFIPLFERNGFITKLDAYVWEQTCRYLAACIAADRAVVPISVNVSRLNLYNAGLCDEIVALAKKYCLPHSLLKLEITESAYMDNPHQLMQTTQQLRDQGFRIMMDDFGSGYSSLNMLKDLPVDALKIDMKFIDDVETSSRAGSVVTSVIRMAKWLDMSIVAEGVEKKSQLDFLRTVGCECVQGYYYAKPMPLEDFDKLLEDNKPSGLRNDMTELLDRFDLDAVWNNREMNLLFNGLIGGMCFAELAGDSMELLRANDGYYQILGATPGSAYADRMLMSLSLEDGTILMAACRAAEETHGVQTFLVRYTHTDGHKLWLEGKVRYLGTRRGRNLLYFALNDVTAQRMREQTLLCMDETFLRYQEYETGVLNRLPMAVAVYLAQAEPNELLFANDKVWELCGTEPQDGMHTISFLRLLRISSAHENAALELVRQVMKTEQPAAFCWNVRDGKQTLCGQIFAARYYDDTPVLQFVYYEQAQAEEG